LEQSNKHHFKWL